MASIDSPRTLDRDDEIASRPTLVSVGRDDGRRPALAVVVTISLLLAAAVSKPWEGNSATAESLSATIPADADLVPAVTSGPVATDGTATTSRPAPLTFAGLDLELMGTSDAHAAWGVAVAYVPRTVLAISARRDSLVVTPVASWEPIEPSRQDAGPMLEHPDGTSVALAVTWPIGTRPVAIGLVSFGPTGPAPLGGATRSSPAAGRPVVLGATLAARIRTSAGQSPGSGLTSGAFYLPFQTPSGVAADWRGHGWRVGAYAFEVELEGGVRATLPFRMGG